MLDTENFCPVQSVKDLNFEAWRLKASSINMSYFNDPFAKCFVEEKNNRGVVLNRSYWARMFTIEQIQKQFISRKGDDSDSIKRQIINMGCGFNTTVFSLLENKDQYCSFRYFDFDLPGVVSRKFNTIMKSAELQTALKAPDLEVRDDDSLFSENYSLAPCDLTDPVILEKQFKSLGIDFGLPTLIITECVFCYIARKETEKFLDFTFKNFDHLCLMNYEMFNPNDDFGMKMVLRFDQLGVPTIGIFDSLADIQQYYQSRRFEIVLADMQDLYSIDSSPNSSIRSRNLNPWMTQ